MNKFGLLDESEEDPAAAADLSEKLAGFTAVRPRALTNLAAVDAAGAVHGFVSREPTPISANVQQGRRRRAIPSEPTRHLAIRLTASGYDRFVAYADRFQLTYHDALSKLMDDAEA